MSDIYFHPGRGIDRVMERIVGDMDCHSQVINIAIKTEEAPSGMDVSYNVSGRSYFMRASQFELKDRYEGRSAFLGTQKKDASILVSYLRHNLKGLESTHRLVDYHIGEVVTSFSVRSGICNSSLEIKHDNRRMVELLYHLLDKPSSDAIKKEDFSPSGYVMQNYWLARTLYEVNLIKSGIKSADFDQALVYFGNATALETFNLQKIIKVLRENYGIFTEEQEKKIGDAEKKAKRVWGNRGRR